MRAPCNISVHLSPHDTYDNKKGSNSTGGCPFKHLHTSEAPQLPTRKMKHLPAKMSQEYEFCYVLNEVAEFSISWNFLQSTSELQVALSAPTQSPLTTFLGFGFEPQFPGMIDADVVIGYVNPSSNSSCVRSMYVPYYVGPPVDDDSMTISNTDVIVGDDRLTVKFTRPFDTGHHNITISNNGPKPGKPGVYFFQTMWAIGESPNTCTGTPNYHGNNRGLRVIDWMNPSSIFPDF